ncbi:MAG: NfeD family protein [Clostridium sp.]|nr:NfeD family protein [Clostridium sp.]
MGMVIIWIIIAIIAIGIDILTSNFLFVWFTSGAVVAMISTLFGVSVGYQIVIFLVVNLITISIGYPWVKKKFKKVVERTPLMEENYIGRVMKAEENIENRVRIKVDGVFWTAQNIGDEIKVGEKFKILGIDGIKLLIKKEEEL